MAPAAGRAGYSVVCKGEQYYDSDEDEAERPDPEVIERKCGCVNAKNPYHKCNQFCAVTGIVTTNEEGMEVLNTCNKSCKCKRPTQPSVKKRCQQALFAPLVGEVQTAPRAELTGMLMALRHGESPQVIVTDHNNHVRTIKKIQYHGIGTIDMMSPMLDLWREIDKELWRRGGMRNSDNEDALWVDL